jgi:hypothetical protein
VTRRWSAQRLAFLEEFVFAPKHADLLKTRESKRENAAFKRRESRGRLVPERKTDTMLTPTIGRIRLEHRNRGNGRVDCDS